MSQRPPVPSSKFFNYHRPTCSTATSTITIIRPIICSWSSVCSIIRSNLCPNICTCLCPCCSTIDIQCCKTSCPITSCNTISDPITSVTIISYCLTSGCLTSCCSTSCAIICSCKYNKEFRLQSKVNLELNMYHIKRL